MQLIAMFVEKGFGMNERPDNRLNKRPARLTRSKHYGDNAAVPDRVWIRELTQADANFNRVTDGDKNYRYVAELVDPFPGESKLLVGYGATEEVALENLNVALGKASGKSSGHSTDTTTI